MDKPKILKSIKYSLEWVDVELIPKIGITNYIKDRIKKIEKRYKKLPPWFAKHDDAIIELQAVLSKIEEWK